MRHDHRIRVRYGETDQMGVVHHSVYPLYFEEARTEFMRALGISYAQMERDGFCLPLIDMGMKFRRGPRYDDLLVIETRLTVVTNVRVRLDYRMFREREGAERELLSTGWTHHACTNERLRPVRLPAAVLDAFREVVEPEPAEDGARKSV